MDAYFETYRDTDNRIACFRCTDNRCTPHFHSNIEIVYVIGGEMEITINGQSKTLTPGCLSVANSYDIHTYVTRGSSENILLIIPVELVPGFSASSKPLSFQSPFLEQCPETAEIFHTLQQLELQNDDPDFFLSKGYAYVILGLLCRTLGVTSRGKSTATDVIREMLMYLDGHYLESLTIEELAHRFGYHKDYLSRFFNAYLGYGFNQYLNILRSRHAARLIDQTDQTLTSIAYQSGFGNYRTFNRAFRSVYRLTPSEYKSQRWEAGEENSPLQ